MLRDFRILAVIGLLAVTGQSYAAPRAKPIILDSFGGTYGSTPEAAVVEGSDGNFYGTTIAGGTRFVGTIYKLTPAGQLVILHSFDGTDGAHPKASLIEGSDSNFYGTTFSGGTNDAGTVFQFSPDGTLVTLYAFGGGDGAHPSAELVEGFDGNFYGTTYDGGSDDDGTVFQITSAGDLTMLHSFNGTDGALPLAGLVQGSDSNFYGTTYRGGTNDHGTVFQITSTGTLTVLYQFDGGTNGSSPAATLTQGRDGFFYGTAAGGSDRGLIFKISVAGELTKLHRLKSLQGRPLISHLVEGNDGTFYGTARGGGEHFGTVFRVGPNGAFIDLYRFWGTADGAFPYAGLTLASDGFFYGTTAFGGTRLHGVIFKIKGLPSTFNGLVIQTNAPSNASSGIISVKLRQSGSFRARLTMAGDRSVFHGHFDEFGNATNTVRRGNLNALQTILHLSEYGGTNAILGTVSDGVFTSELVADQAAFYRGHARACPWKGRYTFDLTPADRNDVNVPQGYGYATLLVLSNGEGRLQGALADGTSIQTHIRVSAIGTWPLYKALYQKGGSCLGTIVLSTNAAIDATIDWFKPATGGRFYPAEFTTALTATGSRYFSTVAGAPSIATNALITLGGGNLSSNIVKDAVIDADGNVTVTPTGDDNLALQITPATGEITGSFFNASINKTVGLNGLLLQIDNSGAGFFLGTNQSGFVVIEPTP
ncbi:MAG TPA: choice-of-anchor tandem repeat GloVer-containing protein [Verrucomicrobiae bacterium]|nr:choice-of-anchor tandem repeat GloVer-containing protein [Verrucomicrobiae bacterium]